MDLYEKILVYLDAKRQLERVNNAVDKGNISDVLYNALENLQAQVTPFIGEYICNAIDGDFLLQVSDKENYDLCANYIYGYWGYGSLDTKSILDIIDEIDVDSPVDVCDEIAYLKKHDFLMSVKRQTSFEIGVCNYPKALFDSYPEPNKEVVCVWLSIREMLRLECGSIFNVLQALECEIRENEKLWSSHFYIASKFLYLYAQILVLKKDLGVLLGKEHLGGSGGSDGAGIDYDFLLDSLLPYYKVRNKIFPSEDDKRADLKKRLQQAAKWNKIPRKRTMIGDKLKDCFVDIDKTKIASILEIGGFDIGEGDSRFRNFAENL